jgi:hypothetical protein
MGMGDKTTRIKRGLSTPFSLGKIHIAANIPYEYRERLKLEMDQFPFGAHDGGIDCLSWYRKIMNTLHFDEMVDTKDIIKISHKLPARYKGCSSMAF